MKRAGAYLHLISVELLAHLGKRFGYLRRHVEANFQGRMTRLPARVQSLASA